MLRVSSANNFRCIAFAKIGRYVHQNPYRPFGKLRVSSANNFRCITFAKIGRYVHQNPYRPFGKLRVSSANNFRCIAFAKIGRYVHQNPYRPFGKLRVSSANNFRCIAFAKIGHHLITSATTTGLSPIGPGSCLPVGMKGGFKSFTAFKPQGHFFVVHIGLIVFAYHNTR